MRRLVVSGGDPIAERVKARRVTFGDAARACLSEIEVGWKNPRVGARWRQVLGEEWMQGLAGIEVGAVGTVHVADALRGVWLTKPTSGAFARGMIERVIDWSVGKGHRDEALANPARWRGGRLRSMLPRQKKGGHWKAMGWRDVPAFYATLGSMARRYGSEHEGGVGQGSARLLQFILLTAVRKSEATFMCWREVNFLSENAETQSTPRPAMGVAPQNVKHVFPTWTIPAERMKGGLEHVVPLSRQAVALLRALPSNRNPDSLVFPSDAFPRQALCQQRLQQPDAEALHTARHFPVVVP